MGIKVKKTEMSRFGRFGRVRGTSEFASRTNFSFLMNNGKMSRRMYFVMTEQPVLHGYAEQRGMSLSLGAGGVGLGGDVGLGDVHKAEKLQEALILSLANLDLTLMQSSVCGILPTHCCLTSLDYMGI